MALLMASDYTEISPVGDVDKRADVLRFYEPRGKVPASVALSMPSVVPYGHIDLVTVRLAFDLTLEGRIIHRSMIASFILRREGGVWLIEHAQYTPYHSGRHAE
ncbi:hypothetical protein NCH01_06320 [Neoasaia chiangmaiensis]|nr:hypothetical protein NCH01_06320 [Neoasaia chiangmaiensis]